MWITNYMDLCKGVSELSDCIVIYYFTILWPGINNLRTFFALAEQIRPRSDLFFYFSILLDHYIARSSCATFFF